MKLVKERLPEATVEAHKTPTCTSRYDIFVRTGKGEVEIFSKSKGEGNPNTKNIDVIVERVYKNMSASK
jgi:hypothetical protein